MHQLAVKKRIIGRRDAQRWKAINIPTTKQYNRREQISTYQTDPEITPIKGQTTHNQHNRHPIIPTILHVVIPDGQNQEPHENLRPNLEPAALDPNESLAQQFRNNPDMILPATPANRQLTDIGHIKKMFKQRQHVCSTYIQ